MRTHLKKFILTVCVLTALLFTGYYAYYHLGIYLFGAEGPVTTFMKTYLMR